MDYSNRTYTILEIVALSAVTFNQVLDTSANTIRENNDNSQFILKYDGTEPPCLTGCTKVQYDGRDFHTHEEALEIVSKLPLENMNASIEDNGILVSLHPTVTWQKRVASLTALSVYLTELYEPSDELGVDKIFDTVITIAENCSKVFKDSNVNILKVAFVVLKGLLDVNSKFNI